LVRSVAIVMAHIAPKDSFEMPLIKDEQVVEALCPYCSHEALRERVGLRGA
jgi:hypothetical protein